LTREDPGVPPNVGKLAVDDPAKGKHRGVVHSLAPSPLDGNLIWAGTEDSLIWVTRDGGKTGQRITDGLPDDASVNVVRQDPVRQDPVRRGLLFAGTTRAVWVSFNDGDSWQSLQLNLPATSMRDLVVHGDDLVVGPHGRSFWILDDITPLRQITDPVVNSDTFLFKPAAAYPMRRDVNTDTPLPPEQPDGAIIDYYLQSSDVGSAKLDIFDPNGKLVRSFSSADKPEVTMKQLNKKLHVPIYWVRPPKILSAEAGMHRLGSAHSAAEIAIP
jgi:hypothetical protein